MNAEAIVAVSAAVTGLTQVAKWAGLPDRWGPIAVLFLAAIGVVIYGYSQALLPSRLELFAYFAGWIAVALTAAGIFGFTRAGASAVISAAPPPKGGAGSSATVQE